MNKREQQLYQEYLAKLRLKDRSLLHTPDGEVGPLERGFTSAVSREDFHWAAAAGMGTSTRVLQRAIGWAGQTAGDAR